MADSRPPPPPPPSEDEPRGAEFWLAPFFRDSSLWPVLAVAALIFVVLAASGLLLALDRNPFAIAAVLLALWGSIDLAIRARRRGGSRLVQGCVAAFWALSIAAAVAARRAGWF
jgi:hypothetical protein